MKVPNDKCHVQPHSTFFAVPRVILSLCTWGMRMSTYWSDRWSAGEKTNDSSVKMCFFHEIIQLDFLGVPTGVRFWQGCGMWQPNTHSCIQMQIIQCWTGNQDGVDAPPKHNSVCITSSPNGGKLSSSKHSCFSLRKGVPGQPLDWRLTSRTQSRSLFEGQISSPCRLSEPGLI